MFRISQSQLLCGQMPIDLLGVEDADYCIKSSGSELINQRQLLLRH